MSRKPILDELPSELDLHLQLDEELTFFLPADTLQLSGLRPGEPLVVDVHPLSLRLEPAGGASGALPNELPIAQVDSEGRIHLPFEPPWLTGRRILLQLRQRGAQREIHLLPDSQ